MPPPLFKPARIEIKWMNSCEVDLWWSSEQGFSSKDSSALFPRRHQYLLPLFVFRLPIMHTVIVHQLENQAITNLNWLLSSFSRVYRVVFNRRFPVDRKVSNVSQLSYCPGKFPTHWCCPPDITLHSPFAQLVLPLLPVDIVLRNYRCYLPPCKNGLGRADFP